MSSLKISVIAALASATLTAGCLYYFNRGRAHEAARLRGKNDAMRVEAYTRTHSPSAAGSAVPVEAAKPAEVSSAPPPKPVENYRNEGRATPLAALETFAWACDRGDTETVAKLLFFDGDARKKTETFMATMPEKARARWKSVDEMAATLLTSAYMEHPFPNADILDVAPLEQVDGERALFQLPGTSKDRIPFQKTADGWSYVITEAMVDAYVARAAAAGQARR